MSEKNVEDALAEVESGLKDPHTKAVEKAFAKGELVVESAYPKRSGSMDPGLALQRLPPRTEEGKEIAAAFARAAPSEPLLFDFPAAEVRIAAALAQQKPISDIEMAVRHAFDEEKGAELPPNVGLIGYDHIVGVGDSVMEAPVGVVISRREQVVRALQTLPRNKIDAIARFKFTRAAIYDQKDAASRKHRRILAKLYTKAVSVLPRGITLDEAMAVLKAKGEK